MRSYLRILAASCVIVALLAAQSTSASTSSTKVLKPDGNLIELDEDNWQRMLTGEWMIEFFAPWCPACKNLAPVWERYANTAKDVNVHVAKIDVTTSPSLSGRFFVTALPTIYHVKDGEFRQYRGARDADALLFFLKKKTWQSIEPLSSWKKPDTIHMSLLSYFFKLSHTLKDFNGRLQEEYGLPIWGSYALFAIATIFVGAALGLMLVCIVDFVYPPKKSPRQSFSESQDNLAKGVEDLATEEIEDDVDENGDEDDQQNSEDDDDDDDEAQQDDEEPEQDEEVEEQKKDTADKVQQKKTDNNKADKTEKSNKQPVDEAPEISEKPSTEQVRKRKPRKAD